MRIALALLALFCVQGTTLAQKVYKHVDEKGNVTYSQTPPANDAKTIKVPPARRVPTTTGHGSAEERRAHYEAERDRRRAEYEQREAERREAMQEARRKQLEALRADCERNRGTDCNDPAALARLEAERGPNQYRPRVR